MTTLVPTRKLLKEYLDDLNKVRLKEFQWYLVQIQIDGSRPIPRSRLENATREATVDKLVEVFGEDGAVEWTVETFTRMNLNDLASKLVQDKADQSIEQREDEPETCSARETPREVDPTVLKDLSCSICLNLFTDPVMLQCGHSFCRSCVHECWERNVVRECSLCKQFIPEGDPPTSFSLKSLCEIYRGRSEGEPSGGHRNNTETFQTPPENIREKQEALKEVKQWRDSSLEHIKTQSCNTEKEIMEVFNMLHDLLDEEEKTRRAALREEARLKIRMIHLMHEKIKNECLLSDIMGEIAKLGAEESFTEDYKLEMESVQSALGKLWTISQVEINVSKHVEYLPLEVLKNMLNDIKQTFADDEDEDSSHQKFNDKRKPRHGNPECSTRYQQNLEKSLKRKREEKDYEDGKVSVHDPDNNTSIQTHEGTFTQCPVSNNDDTDSFEAEDEDEQGHAETFREEGAQS